MANQPDRPPPPPAVQKLRLRYAKRGRLRFTSHRDIQRSLERALRRAQVPMAYSAGFSPHPKVSYAGAAPTGAASEAEYLEISLTERRDPEQIRAALDAAMPSGLDIVDARDALPGALADLLQASEWEIALPGLAEPEVAVAVAGFVAAEEVGVDRATKRGTRTLDARGPVHHLAVITGEQVRSEAGRAAADAEGPCAILHLVVRHTTPVVRPDDVLAALHVVADLAPPSPPRATRLAQGPFDEVTGSVGDPLADHHAAGSRLGTTPEPQTHGSNGSDAVATDGSS